MGHVCRKVVCASGQRVGLARLRIKPVQVLASRNAALSRRARGISAEVVQGAFGGRDDSGLHCPRARSGDCTTPGLACWMHGLRVEIAAASLGAASLMLGMLLNPCPCRSALPPPADVATRVETPGRCAGDFSQQPRLHFRCVRIDHTSACPTWSF